MNYPISVFLDSNVFIACKYNTSKDSELGILLRYIKGGKINLFLSNIVKREVESHISEDVDVAIGQLKKALKTAKNSIALQSLKETKLYSYFDLPTKECIENQLKMQFEEYLKNCGTTILNNDGVICDGILDDYFSSIPPFENREKKKHEFPDAIMSAKLKKEFSDGNVLWVVSNDMGFKKSFDGNPQFKCVSRLQEIYDLINKNDKVYQEVENYFADNIKQIQEAILNELKLTNIEVDGTDCDKKGLIEGYDYNETEICSISNLKAHLDSVDEISEDTAIVTVRCSAKFYAYCSYDDFSNGVWDSEDREYIFLPHYDIYEEHEPDFYCELNLGFQEKETNHVFSIEAVECNVRLDQNSRVSRIIHDPEEDDEDYKDNVRGDQLDALEEYYRH